MIIKTAFLLALAFTSVAHADIAVGTYKGTALDGLPCEFIVSVKSGVQRIEGYYSYTNFGTEPPHLVPATFEMDLVHQCYDADRKLIWCGVEGGGYGQRIFVTTDSKERPLKAAFSKQARDPWLTCTMNRKSKI